MYLERGHPAFLTTLVVLVNIDSLNTCILKNVLIKITIKYSNFNTSLCQHIYSLDGGNNSERQADFSAKKN